jgi:hypothetical protein
VSTTTTQARPDAQAAAVCNHTLRHDAPGSTWETVSAPGGRKVVCRVCGRFYGYMAPTGNAAPSLAEQTGQDEAGEPEQRGLFEMEEAGTDA